MSRRDALKLLFLARASGAGTRAAPYGAARVASYLKKELGSSVSVAIENDIPGEGGESLAARSIRLAPDVLGLSLYVWNREELLAAAAEAKAALPGIMVVAGGPEASADPQGILSGSAVDYVVKGEGELAMLELCQELLASGRAGPQPIRARAMPDLSVLPSPWLDGTLDPARYGGAALELTRGCPYRCAFCYESKGDARLRRFTLEGVRAELARLQEAGVEEVFVLDPTFNADNARMEEAVRAMRAAGPDLRYYVELRGELVDRKQARLLASLDLSAQIGLQSSDPAVLALVNRKFEPARFSKALRALEEEGVLYGLDIIYGLPGDSLAGFKRSVDYALALGPNHLDLFRLALLPGTVLHDEAGRLGIQADDGAPYLTRSLPGFSEADLDEAEAFAHAAESFYNRGRAVMWFRPLTEALGKKPSAVIAAWRDWLKRGGGPNAKEALKGGESLAHEAIEELQLGFLREFCGGPRGAALADAACQLVRVSGAWTRALAEGQSTRLELDWEPEELLDYAPAGLREFAAEAERSRGAWLCRPAPRGPEFVRTPKAGLKGAGRS